MILLFRKPVIQDMPYEDRHLAMINDTCIRKLDECLAAIALSKGYSFRSRAIYCRERANSMVNAVREVGRLV